LAKKKSDLWSTMQTLEDLLLLDDAMWSSMPTLDDLLPLDDAM
jgi:hypothetical protein